MTIRNQKTVDMPRRPGVKSDICDQALSRWNPDIQASTASDDAKTISILGPIGEDWYGDGVTAKRISAALRNIGAQPVTVTINSPGGDFFEGLAIYNILLEHSRTKGMVTIKIVGLAASAASVIAMAGDEVLIARAGFLMIHNTWVMAAGDRNAFREVADWLEPFDSAAVDIYHARSGIDPKELGRLLDKDTWLGGKKAVDQGFADGLLGDDDVISGAQNAAGMSAKSAQSKMDIHLARQNVPKSERRKMYAAMKGGTSRAAPTGTSSAAVSEVAHTALEKLKSI